MARKSGVRKLDANKELGNSWVVDNAGGADSAFEPERSEDDSEEEGEEAKVDLNPPSLSPRTSSADKSEVRRRRTRNSPQPSHEPELIMPSIPEGASRPSPARRPKTSADLFQTGKSSKPNRRGAPPRQEDKVKAVIENVAGMAWSLIKYATEVVSMALHNLKTPISYIIAIWILVGLVMITRNLFTQSMHLALSPVCRLPGASLLGLQFCKSRITSTFEGQSAPPAEFDRLMTTQAKFEDILAASSNAVALPLDMKRSEASVRDLRTVVQHSSLKSRNELVLEFDGFIETARMASYDLQRFNSHVGRSVDNVLNIARLTQRKLDTISAEETSRSGIAAFISDRVLAPFQPLHFSQDPLLDQYIKHTRGVEDEIMRLLDEAQALLQILQNLEERLDLIHGISVRDSQIAKSSRDEVLSQLWTILGGNSRQVEKFNSQLQMLQQINIYRKNAWEHVAATVLKLQAMGAELEELRERVGATELLKHNKDVPLAVHIANIQMGVERLEIGREKSRTTEKEYTRSILDRGQEQEVVKGKLIDAGSWL